jgi:hypothetical protein
MPSKLHRLMAHLFHGHHGPHPIIVPAPEAALPPRRGIPDGLIDKLPPPDERLCDHHYTRDPLTHHFVQVPDPHPPDPASGQH